MTTRPLEGIVVLEFAQYMAAPTAGLRLADLGARVIKIERPGSGDGGRQISTKNLHADGDTLIFHTINRNKESYAADLKKPADVEKIRQLIARADVMTHNFRPGVMEKLGFDYDHVRQINPRIIYSEVTGYGPTGPWKDKPGQDLLLQAVSGLTWLTGNRGDGPTPFGLAVADIICGAHFAQGILAALVQRERTGVGARVETSLLESVLDLQFEVLTTHLNDGGRLPRRSKRFNAHAYLAAPYGVYPTLDGYLALAMGDIARLGMALGCDGLAAYTEPDAGFRHRDEIQSLLADHLKMQSTTHWLDRLAPQDIWCADVYDYARLTAHDAWRVLQMDQTVTRPSGATIRTTRCPIRIDGERLTSTKAAPVLGYDNAQVEADFLVGSAPRTEAVENAVRNADPTKPLQGLLVVDLSQFLSGPSASLRLADLGARVIKVERAGTGDICRQLYASDARIDGESTVFHAINRNKESLALDLKKPDDRRALEAIIRKADVVMHNFRPGVVERLGLDYAVVRRLKADIVYGHISGYGTEGRWRDKPGQDLLVQSLTGLTWLSGNGDGGPVPMGLSVVDQLVGAHLAQGILACLVRRGKTGEGGLVEASMIESSLDFQFEAITNFLQDGEPVVRSREYNAHALLGAPYGIYPTADGHLALAMAKIPQLGELLGCPPLLAYTEPGDWFTKRDEIKKLLANHLRGEPTAFWLSKLEPADIWCAEVLDWKRLLAHEAFAALGMVQTVTRGTGTRYPTTRCPIRFNGQRLLSDKGSPDLGEHAQSLLAEFGVK